MKALVLCVDSLDEGYLRAFAPELPCLSRLMTFGCWGEVEAQVPQTVPSWAEFGLGREPVGIGRVDHITGIKHAPLWEAAHFDGEWNLFEALDAGGLSVGVYHLPVWTQPPEHLGYKLEGRGGWVVQGDWRMPGACWPECLPIETDFGGTHVKCGGWISGVAGDRLPPTRKLEARRSELKGRAAAWGARSAREVARLLALRPVDVLVAYWYCLDMATHSMVDDLSSMRALYSAANHWCEDVIRAAAPEEFTLVIGDHGAKPLHLTRGTQEIDGLVYSLPKRDGRWQVFCGRHRRPGAFILSPGPKRRSLTRMRQWAPWLAERLGAKAPEPIALGSALCYDRPNFADADAIGFSEQVRCAIETARGAAEDEAILDARLMELGYE